ncbi:exosome component 10 isoform X3 [Enhydra lutris kenyoni]|uniref:Exosome complex component 10 n=1 Tax=Enhydra lutris kenyoni TaxID=391180 RepID=A0A2Y9KLE6_ENHLU|nr:exosome component 10 isoform X3 [Enhydra lutris kenyoni]
MAPPSPREPKAPTATSAANPDGEMVLPGFPDADSFVKFALGSVVAVTKASGGLPQFGDEYDFYRSFPGFQAFCETQGDRLLQCMSRVMQYHGCRSNIKDRSKVTELEDKFDLLVDTNDVILERVGILLDEASGVNKNQQPILPAGLQVPKTIVSSWNRKAGEYSKKTKSETFRLLHAKNIVRPQLKFREKIDNSNTPFLPKIFIKPNAQKPLPQALSKERRERPQDRPEDLDVPPALADFIHQQRTQQVEQDMFAHPYQYELDHFTPPDSVLQKPQPQLYRPVAETPCHFVSSLDELVELNEKLLTCQEFAVDLEHHSYRSFLGLTCLMQISTRAEDFIVDTLELRSDMYILNESLTDPAVVKVFHGADSDIEWLQKDFGLYVVNMFDTHQAARLLNLGRHSLDHLLKLYCGVESNKQYQLADWRIRPLPEEMLHYARDDTHYLLYIYDKMRLELWEQGNEQPAQLQVVWQRSRDICLKKFVKPIFTDESYLELYRKQKKHLNTQQLTAFQLLFAWRDKTARREDESYGYVLPNHMMLKVAEELPKEPQGIIACCNPVPPLVRQQLNEIHLLIQQAREMPLLKSEVAAGVRKSGPLPGPERLENVLFGPHDCSHASSDGHPVIPSNGNVEPAPAQKQASLFPDQREETLPDTRCLIATAVITLFNEPSAEETRKSPLTVAQKKAQNIMASFENPFKMFLPSLEHRAHVSQAAKFDPSSKIYEISNRWKLASQVQTHKGPKETAKEKAAEQTAARDQAQEEYKATAEQAVSVRQQAALESAAKKRERTTSDPRTTEQKQEKKRLKTSKKPKDPDPPEKDFTPYDYSKSDFKAFAGNSKAKPSQFDPNKQTQPSKKCVAPKKLKQSVGNKSMSFPTGKSDRGFRHSWPKR